MMDGSVLVGYDSSGIATLSLFSSVGSNVWQTTLPGSIVGECKALKVGKFVGDTGSFIEFEYSDFIRRGFLRPIG